MFENSEKLFIILVIALLVLGPSKLAGLGGTLGRAIRDFRNSVREAQDTFASSVREAHETFTSTEQSYASQDVPPPQALPAPDPSLQPAASSTAGHETPLRAPEPAQASVSGDLDEFEGPHSLASEPSAEAVRESAQH